ncbi:DUF1559 domain-containing protein [Blastopirellula sp. J2-11]|uniref:DUF1559 domain-containing protein n=1 Tax=Blastopirellula sp. J2-11 TaxID=2943192 RepID=UPI0021C9251D|nr:DUF1559 domain-containing protein [Blastopirellula sp. J2-11]UUO04992.1 DUF1559 domain-containing protein [Blastopirellula sp. J2-11]
MAALALQRGFTLLELLVVMAIIGVLISLILPAERQAREAARRIQCSANLTQLVLVLHVYDETHGSFPRGNPLRHGAFDSSATIYMTRLLQEVTTDNLIFLNKPVQSGARFADIVDSASHTAVLSETKKGPGGSSSSASTGFGNRNGYRVATWLTSNFADTPENLLAPPAECEISGNTVWNYRGLQYYRGSMTATFYTHTLTPNSGRRDCMDGSKGTRGHAAPRSYHPGGVSVAFAAGSVSFASDTIDMTIWRALETIASGEDVVTR